MEVVNTITRQVKHDVVQLPCRSQDLTIVYRMNTVVHAMDTSTGLILLSLHKAHFVFGVVKIATIVILAYQKPVVKASSKVPIIANVAIISPYIVLCSTVTVISMRIISFVTSSFTCIHV